MDPYGYCYNNPVNLIDPTGMVPEDWIKNKETGEYIWDSKVTSAANTPEGFSYVGKDNQSITKDLFGGTRFSTKTTDTGTIDFQDFDNPYSAKGVAPMYMNAKTNMSINLLANVTEKRDASGNFTSKTFNGIDISVVVSGKVIAPYPDMDPNLFEREMTMQGNPMSEYRPKTAEYTQGGDVRSLIYKSSWSAKSIQNNFGSSFDVDFKFKGQYANGVRSMTMPGILGALGIPNTTNSSARIKFRNGINTKPKSTPIKP